MADRHGVAIWPGVASFWAGTYTCSHGISPGTAVLTINPQNPQLLAGQADLLFTDGANTVRIPRCKLENVGASSSGGVIRQQLTILDRRWQWRECGVISGCYNQPDVAGEITRPPPDSPPTVQPALRYIPWTIKSPHDLMRLCLAAMGETRYRILLPDFASPLPTVDWDAMNPAQALSELVEKLGGRIVYRLDTDSVLIAPVGVGAQLPEGGSIKAESLALIAPERPDQIWLVGAPVRIQVRLALEPVGEEWDGSIRPIEHLSYKPLVQEAQQQVVVFTFPTVVAGDDFTITLNGVASTRGSEDGTAANIAEILTASINGKGINLRVQAVGDAILVRGLADGTPFQWSCSATGTSKIVGGVQQAARPIGNAWANSGPPDFPLVQATNRLTYQQALALARKSVFRWYRCINVDPQTKKAPFSVPTIGKLTRIQQLVLLNTQVEHILPPLLDERVVNKADGALLVRSHYDGLTRDRPARCYGSYYPLLDSVLDSRVAGGIGGNFIGLLAGGAAAMLGDSNTFDNAEVMADFSIDAERYLVMFNELILRRTKYTTEPARITLQTAVQVRDATNNQIIRYIHKLTMPGVPLGTLPAIIRHDDVEYLVIGFYSPYAEDYHKLMATRDNALEAAGRANYYLRGAAAKYETKGSVERTWNGIEPIWLDGAIQQVTWEVGGGNTCSTTASRNSEHALYIPTLLERQRLEYQSPLERTRKMTLKSGELSKGKPPGNANG